MLVISLPPEAGVGESDARLPAGRRNTAACSSPEPDGFLRTFLQTFPLLCPAGKDLPAGMDTLRLRRHVSPEADADLRSLLEAFRLLCPASEDFLSVGLARSCFRAIAPTYTHTPR